MRKSGINKHKSEYLLWIGYWLLSKRHWWK
jgi:hypothetical protein